MLVVTVRAMCFVVSQSAWYACTYVVDIADAVDTWGVADGGQASVEALGVEVVGFLAGAGGGGGAAASETPGAADRGADVVLAVVLVALTADGVVCPGQVRLEMEN